LESFRVADDGAVVRFENSFKKMHEALGLLISLEAFRQTLPNRATKATQRVAYLLCGFLPANEGLTRLAKEIRRRDYYFYKVKMMLNKEFFIGITQSYAIVLIFYLAIKLLGKVKSISTRRRLGFHLLLASCAY